VLNDIGEAIYADNTILSHANKILGMTTEATLTGAITDSSWSWVLNTPIWLSSSGLLTQVAPVTGFSLIVAFPISTTKIYINLREPSMPSSGLTEAQVVAMIIGLS
jgi:hypothetical protein